MKALLELLSFIWQLPQTLLGYIILLFCNQTHTLNYKGRTIRVCKGFPGGISLGYVVIVNKFPYNPYTWNTVKHEWGHTRQSLYLGPLYLLVIGLPSIIWAWLYGPIIKPSANGYYKFYTERLADKLGGVIRES